MSSSEYKTRKAWLASLKPGDEVSVHCGKTEPNLTRVRCVDEFIHTENGHEFGSKTGWGTGWLTEKLMPPTEADRERAEAERLANKIRMDLFDATLPTLRAVASLLAEMRTANTGRGAGEDGK